jgi:hypothetical protein
MRKSREPCLDENQWKVRKTFKTFKRILNIQKHLKTSSVAVYASLSTSLERPRPQNHRPKQQLQLWPNCAYYSRREHSLVPRRPVASHREVALQRCPAWPARDQGVFPAWIVGTVGPQLQLLLWSMVLRSWTLERGARCSTQQRNAFLNGLNVQNTIIIIN